MITAVHTLLYCDDADQARAFFRDVLEWPYLDEGGGWLIFRTGPSELGVHPTTQGEWSSPQKHEISFICDDLEATVTDLKSKGAEFTGQIEDEDYGLTINLRIPGGPEVMLYQPKYEPPALGEE